MFIGKATILNSAGIHCRPTALIFKAAASYEGTINVVAPSGSAGLSSMLELMSLGLEQGTEIQIEVNGPDEEAVAAKMVELFETHFDFPPKD